ncbi:MAG: hypothetical protein K6E49_00375 [Lachnospiraceae bacterium]|nr:hypothetical protein [Lachnospiraceae bacterium]
MAEMETLEEVLGQGQGIYSELCRHEDIQFIVCPASLGDTVNVGAFLTTYKKIHNVKKVILVVKEHQVPLAGIFPGADQCFALTNDEMVSLRYYLTVFKKEKDNNVLYGYFSMKDDRLWETSNAKLTNFVDEYKSLILDIPLDSVIDNIRIPQINEEDRDRFTNTVLLMPFCQGKWRCSDDLWNGLISYYKEHGVREIYTNIGNPADHAIEGTEGLSLSVPELLAYSDQFTKIIGIRGGIFDVLALRDDVKTDVITPDIESRFWGKCEIDTTRHPLYYGIKNLNPNAKVREYSYTEGCDDTLIKEITITE